MEYVPNSGNQQNYRGPPHTGPECNRHTSETGTPAQYLPPRWVARLPHKQSIRLLDNDWSKEKCIPDTPRARSNFLIFLTLSCWERGNPNWRTTESSRVNTPIYQKSNRRNKPFTASPVWTGSRFPMAAADHAYQGGNHGHVSYVCSPSDAGGKGSVTASAGCEQGIEIRIQGEMGNEWTWLLRQP